jgi:hypothetical protein
MSLLAKVDGSGFDGDGLSMCFAEAINQAGSQMPAMHGLGKSAARMLAGVGFSTHQIASITGRAALAEIERYTAVKPEKLAMAAINKLEQNAERTARGKRSVVLVNLSLTKSAKLDRNAGPVHWRPSRYTANDKLRSTCTLGGIVCQSGLVRGKCAKQGLQNCRE